MRSLNEVASGSVCRVIWLIGRIGTALQKETGIDLDDTIVMIRNLGVNGVIVAVSGKRYAMDSNAAFAVKVELLSSNYA